MRQFLCPCQPDKKGRLSLSGKDYRYLVKVLRLREGGTIDARLPDGKLAVLRITAVGKTAVELCLDTADSGAAVQGVKSSAIEDAFNSRLEIWLFQFMPQPQKMDLIVRQAVECGVSKIIPVAGEFSQKSDAAGRLDRWKRIAREARQQSGSPVDTEILPCVSLKEAVSLWNEYKLQSQKISRAFLLHENPEFGMKALVDADLRGADSVVAAIAVGAEGGISNSEMETFNEAGFLPVHFATNVLRTETAALYGTAVIQQYLNFMLNDVKYIERKKDEEN